MSDGGRRPILVFGYGNPGRADDGLGIRAAEIIAARGLPNVAIETAFQLNIEDAELISGYDLVVFVDASVAAPEPFSFEGLVPADSVTFTSHAVSPGSILKLCADHFGPAPETYVCAIRGYSFEFEEGLSEEAQRNLGAALTFLADFLSQHAPLSRPAYAT